jgi:hypothetical protein
MKDAGDSYEAALTACPDDLRAASDDNCHFDIAGSGTRRGMSDKTLAHMASAEEHMEVPVEIAVANSVASGVLGIIRKYYLLLPAGPARSYGWEVIGGAHRKNGGASGD